MSSLFDHVGITNHALSYHLERQNVLSSNIANVDTPGFQPMELTREIPEAEDPRRLALTATNPNHVGYRGRGGPPRQFTLDFAEERVSNPGNDGNSVSLEREMSKVAVNQLRYEGAVRIVRSQLGLLRYAANDGH